jgi:hypothetical protein
MRPATWDEATAELTHAMERRTRRYDQLRDIYIGLMVAADPRLGRDMTMHLCHNWGNPEAQALLERYNAARSRITSLHMAWYDRWYTEVCMPIIRGRVAS